MKKLIILLIFLYLPTTYAYELKQITSQPNYLEFVFNHKVNVLNNTYLTPRNALILDFAPFTNTIDTEALKHDFIISFKLAHSNKLSRASIRFDRPITYRLENKEARLRVYFDSHTKLPQSTKKTQIKAKSLRDTLKSLAKANHVDLVISGKINGEAVMQISEETDPQDAMLALVEANNLNLSQQGSVWMITPDSPSPSKSPAIKEIRKFNATLIPLRYAKAADLVKTIKSAKNTLLSAKGSVSADERTNSLLINDTDTKITEIKNLIQKLDKPLKQVLIRSKIVIATNDFAKSLGVRFGISHHGKSGKVKIGISGKAGTSNTSVNGVIPTTDNRFNINLPANTQTGSIGLTIAKLPFGTLLDLELSASQLEGKTKTIASPHVMTADGATAYIQQGVQVPYRTETNDTIDVKFKDALMELRVTPQITPNNHIIMTLTVKKDAVGSILCNDCEPSIDTREVKTTVRIKNGETLVIGGISEESSTKQNDSVPGISKIPLLGKLFQRKSHNRNKRELLIFITPKIVAE